MPFYYIPQNAWGLVEQAHYDTAGFYSMPGGPRRPVALWCGVTQRGAYTHFDGNQQAVNRALVDWLANGDDANVIAIYATEHDIAVDIQAQILATLFYENAAEDGTAIIDGSNPEESWWCQFTDDGPDWVDQDGLEGVHTPDNWSDYWVGAPEWNGTGTFTTAIVDDLKGFIANYNGKFYFDFHEDED